MGHCSSQRFIIPGLLGLADREIGVRRVRLPRSRLGHLRSLRTCSSWAAGAGRSTRRPRRCLQSTQVTSAPVKRIASRTVSGQSLSLARHSSKPDSFYQTAEINTTTGAIDSDPQRDVLYMPADTPAVEAAKHTFLGKVYLDWGTWAVVREVGQEPVPGMDPPHLPPNRTWTTVEFSDLRFDYSFRGTGRPSGPSPLSGWVYIVDGRDDAGEVMGGREQK